MVSKRAKVEDSEDEVSSSKTDTSGTPKLAVDDPLTLDDPLYKLLLTIVVDCIPHNISKHFYSNRPNTTGTWADSIVDMPKNMWINVAFNHALKHLRAGSGVTKCQDQASILHGLCYLYSLKSGVYLTAFDCGGIKNMLTDKAKGGYGQFLFKESADLAVTWIPYPPGAAQIETVQKVYLRNYGNLSSDILKK